MVKALGVQLVGLAFVGATACAVDGTTTESVGSRGQAYGSCDGLPTWQSNNWAFQVARGEVIQYGGNAYQANQDVTYPNAECAPDNPASWCASWFTNLGACGADAPSPPSADDSSGSSDPCDGIDLDGGNVCDGNVGIDAAMGALAVAMANEIGELEVLRDLEVGADGMVRLTSTGRSNCNARGGCANIDAILALQDSAVNDVVCQEVFNATSFSSNLKSSYQLQKDREASAAMNGGLPAPHTLALVSTADASCGTDWAYNVSKKNCTPSSTTSSGSGGSCDGVPSYDADNWQFQPTAGSFVQDGGHLYQTNIDISYPNAECAPHAPASWCASWFTDEGECGGGAPAPTSDDDCSYQASDLSLKMGFFRDNNPVLNARYSGSQMTLDPTGTLNDGGTNDSGSCMEACIKFTRKAGNLLGKCCSCKGKMGEFRQGNNSFTMYCDTNL